MDVKWVKNNFDKMNRSNVILVNTLCIRLAHVTEKLFPKV